MELEIIAFIASTLGVGGSLPQIVKILKTNDTMALSYGKFSLGVLSGLLWVSYGVMAPVYSIVFWNSISTVCNLTVVFLKLRNEHPHLLRAMVPSGRLEGDVT